MRAVADALGVAPMSLYTHVRDKADLLTGLAGCALENLDFEVTPKGDWRDEIHEWAHALRRTLLDYAEVASLMEHQHWQSPQLLRIIRRPVRILVERGLAEGAAVEVVKALVWTAFGFVVIEGGERHNEWRSRSSREAELGVALASMSRAERTEIGPLIPHLVTREFDRLYEAILRRVLESLEKECSAGLNRGGATS